jgi:16S rRNA (guanine966-N2)-methyltransferase
LNVQLFCHNNTWPHNWASASSMSYHAVNESMPRKKKNDSPHQRGRLPSGGPATDSDIRIVGGEFRGRRLRYHGDQTVRPMKHRVREAIFNLISTDVVGRHVIDLFAGTGALAFEALSRGAADATLIEKHVPTARIIEENIRSLGVANRTELRVTSAFLWIKRDLAAERSSSSDENPWLVFCSPPYAFYVERAEEMLDLINRLQRHAPPSSMLVVEADEQFDFDLLQGMQQPESVNPETANTDVIDWSIRAYPPAVIGIGRMA